MKLRRTDATLISIMISIVVVACASYGLPFDAVGLTFFAVVIQSCVFSIMTGWRLVSLVSIYFIFSLIFFGIVPWIQYAEGMVIWGGLALSSLDYILANSLILASGFVVFGIYRFFVSRSRLGSSAKQVRELRSRWTPWVLLAISAFSLLSLLALHEFSLQSLLIRGGGGADDGVIVENSSLRLILSTTLRLLPFFCFVMAITEVRGRTPLKIILFAILLLSVFPTGVARYMVAFVYVPVLLLLSKNFRRSGVFAGFLVGAVGLVFPFLNQFRSYSGFESISLLPDKNFFLAAHFDAYENLAHALQIEFITHGNQLLGVIFFFVPRSFWGSKPVGSGYEMAERLGFSFNNISMPFLGEGYVNFGIPGVFAFSAALAVVMAKLDARFVPLLSKGLPGTFRKGIYLYLCGALFFVLRGDLLSSVAYTTSGLVVALILEKVCMRRVRTTKA